MASDPGLPMGPTYPPGQPTPYPPGQPMAYPPANLPPAQYPPGMYPPPGFNPWIGAVPPSQGAMQPPVTWAPTAWPGDQFSRPQPGVMSLDTDPISKAPTARGGDEYMVDSMRRIYGNSGSSIEIERVKVHRRQPGPGMSMMPFPALAHRMPNVSNPNSAIVPVAGPQLPPERRPPPRKHRKNKLNNELVRVNTSPQTSSYQQQCYPPPPPPPFMQYMPYPYPYPYNPYLNYMWPPPWPGWGSNAPKENTEEDHQTATVRSLQASPNSQRLESSGTTRSIRDSISPDVGRSLSPTASSQVSRVTESQATDIGPSDSVSVGGYGKTAKTYNEKAGYSNTPKWVKDMQSNISNLDDSSEVGDKLSFTTAQSTIPSPAVRRNKGLKSPEEVKSNEDDDTQSTISDKSSSDLNNAFKNLERSVGRFTNQVSIDTSQSENVKDKNSSKQYLQNSEINSREKPIAEDNFQDAERASSSASFHSVKNSSDIIVAETDSTDIFIASDAATADEELPPKRRAPLPPGLSPPASQGDREGGAPAGDRGKWVLQGPGEAPDVAISQGTNTWLADVSVWRARLVVSLDKGQGLDQQDWATFHLLIQHPLPLRLKLSLLHASRICAANGDVGAVSVRAALLQLARHAQVLLQKEDGRPSGWKSITAHNSQPWMPVKGGVEILGLLGYRARDDNTLRYSRRLALEASRLARLTLDLLVFADELRLYLTGTHGQPTNISDLFCPITFSPSVTPEPLGLRMDHQDSRSVGSSTDFISAETTPVMERKAINDSDDQSNILSQEVRVDYNKQLLEHYSSSEEEVTLHEDDVRQTESSIAPVKCIENTDDNKFNEIISDRRSMSTDITSLPDLQSLSSLPPSRLSNARNPGILTDASNVSSPVNTPEPPVDSEIKQQEEKREDHIYEEIGEIRTQVNKLRSSVSVPNFPPPLPPKTKLSTTYQDEDSFSAMYSRSDWSAPSSFGGSTGRRRKKRRAPLPPSFLYEDQIRELEKIKGALQETSCSSSNKLLRRDLNDDKEKNPFYEEIGEARPKLPEKRYSSDSSKENFNPFKEKNTVPSGYVGTNPFYEDIAVVKANIARQFSNTGSMSDDSNSVSAMNSTSEIQFDRSDGKTPPVAAARPKRKAPRPPRVNNEDQTSIINQDPTPPPNEEMVPLPALELTIDSNVISTNDSSHSIDRIPSDSELQEVDLNSTTDEVLTNNDELVANKTNIPDCNVSKNVSQKQFQCSQDAVSVSELSITESKQSSKVEVMNSCETSITENCNSMLNGKEISPSIIDTLNNDGQKKLSVIDCVSESENTDLSAKCEPSESVMSDKIDLVAKKLDDADSSTSGSGPTTVTAVADTRDQLPQSSEICDGHGTLTINDTKGKNMNKSAVVVQQEGNDTLLHNVNNNDEIQLQQCEIGSATAPTIEDKPHVDQLKIKTNEIRVLGPVNTDAVKSLINDSAVTQQCTGDRGTSTDDRGTSTDDRGTISNIKYIPLDNSKDNNELCPIRPDPEKFPMLTNNEEIPYIDNSDVNNYKKLMEDSSPRVVGYTSFSPLLFLRNSIPFIDDGGNASCEPPPPPFHPPPSETPPLTPDTPHASPPPSPPPVELGVIDNKEEVTVESQLKRLSKISEHFDLEARIIEKNVDEDQDELKSSIVFGKSDNVTRSDQSRPSSGYYEIPEAPEGPPPLPAKPGNLLSGSMLQKTPKIPPKSSTFLTLTADEAPQLPPKSPRLVSPKLTAPTPLTDDDKYEIPDVANFQAPQMQYQVTDDFEESSVSTSPLNSLSEDVSSNPSKPPRRRRHSACSPPRPPKTFGSQFSGLGNAPPSVGHGASSNQPRSSSTLPIPNSPQGPRRQMPRSTPSTPQPIPRQNKTFLKNPTDRSRKSWPYLFCDCVDSKYESNAYNKKNF